MNVNEPYDPISGEEAPPAPSQHDIIDGASSVPATTPEMSALDESTASAGDLTVPSVPIAKSRRHVLAAADLVFELPSPLFRALMLLAVCADHVTGLSTPGAQRVKAADIGKSAWNDQCKALKALGLISIRKGIPGRKAPTYRLLILPVYIRQGTSAENWNTSPEGKGFTGTAGRPTPTKTLPLQGSTPEKRTYPEPPPLTAPEEQVWTSVKEQLAPLLGEAEWRRLAEGHAAYDQLIPLKRTIVRLCARIGVPAVVEVLGRREDATVSPYDGTLNIWRAIWARVRILADDLGFHMFNHAPVVHPDSGPAPASAAPRTDILDKLAPGWRSHQADLMNREVRSEHVADDVDHEGTGPIDSR